MAAASVSIQQLSEELLFCPICLERFQDPKQLQCHHTFCKTCLDPLLTDMGNITCPTCRKLTAMGRKGVSCLPPDRVVVKLLDMILKQENVILNHESRRFVSLNKRCNICEESTPAVTSCEDCSEFLCEFHTETHRQGHRIIELEEMDSLCPVHKSEAYKMFCETCKELVCCECAVLSHQHHKLNIAKVVAQMERDRIISLVEEADHMLLRLKENLTNLETRNRQVSQHGRTVAYDISEFIDHQQALLKTRGDKLVKNAQDLVQKEIDRISLIERQQRALLGHVESFKKQARNLHESCSDVKVIQCKDELYRRLGQLSLEPHDISECVNEPFELLFKQNSLPDESIDSIGSVARRATPDPMKCEIRYPRCVERETTPNGDDRILVLPIGNDIPIIVELRDMFDEPMIDLTPDSVEFRLIGEDNEDMYSVQVDDMDLPCSTFRITLRIKSPGEFKAKFTVCGVSILPDEESPTTFLAVEKTPIRDCCFKGSMILLLLITSIFIATLVCTTQSTCSLSFYTQYTTQQFWRKPQQVDRTLYEHTQGKLHAVSKPSSGSYKCRIGKETVSNQRHAIYDRETNTNEQSAVKTKAEKNTRAETTSSSAVNTGSWASRGYSYVTSLAAVLLSADSSQSAASDLNQDGQAEVPTDTRSPIGRLVNYILDRHEQFTEKKEQTS